MMKSEIAQLFCWRSSRLVIGLVGTAVSAGLALGGSTGPTQAAPFSPAKELRDQAREDSPIITVRAVVRRGGAVVGPRGGAPGYCWYYTDQSRQQGFWDACP